VDKIRVSERLHVIRMATVRGAALRLVLAVVSGMPEIAMVSLRMDTWRFFG
jgi:hypothetical protein